MAFLSGLGSRDAETVGGRFEMDAVAAVAVGCGTRARRQPEEPSQRVRSRR